MRQTKTDTLMQLVQGHPDIPEHVKHALARAVDVSKPRPKGGWVDMLSTLRKDRRSIETNMHNRSETMAPVYAEYLTLMSAVRKLMEQAQEHDTPADAEREAALVNEQRAREGRKPMGTCGKSWQSWLPQHIKERFAAKVTATYDSVGYKRGNRFVPFITAAARSNIKKVAANLTTTIARIRQHHESAPGTGRGNTPYRALYLCAARMAERSLSNHLKAIEAGVDNPVDSPLPVNWLALLDGPMRARLRQAQENPAAVVPEGLEQFYEPVPEENMPDFAYADAAHAIAHQLEDSE